MRIIAGEFKGRRLKAPDSRETRPVTDKVKESIFSSLGMAVVGARVADLYAGAGSFGLEALSRGAQSAVFVERARKALVALRANIDDLRLGRDRATVVAAPVERHLSDTTEIYDLVFCDPPWAFDSVTFTDVLDSIADHVDANGQVVISRDAVDPLPEPRRLVIDDDRRHGDTRIIRYLMEDR